MPWDENGLTMHTMSPWERIYEWQWGNTTDAGRLHDNDNMVNVVHLDYIHTTYSEHTFLAVGK